MPRRSRSPTTRRAHIPARVPSLVIGATLVALLVAMLAAAGGAGAGVRAASPQPSAPAWGERRVEVRDGDRSFQAQVFHPLTDPAWDGRTPLPGGPWPVVIFGHGYLTPVERDASTLRSLAAAGFLVVAPTSGGELFPDHAAFAADLSAQIDWLAAETSRPDGWLTGAVDMDRIAASGHSMGGGVSILAAAADPRIRTAATLAAAETRPSAIEAAAGIEVPILLIAGAVDAIAPVASHQRPMFEAITGAPAQLRVIDGGSHCGFLDPPEGGAVADVLTSLACDEGTITVSEQLAITGRLLIDWLRLTLQGDESLRDAVWSAAVGDGTTIETHLP